jgi:hypothetical protein
MKYGKRGSELLPLQATETGFPSALSYSLVTVFTELLQLLLYSDLQQIKLKLFYFFA